MILAENRYLWRNGALVRTLLAATSITGEAHAEVVPGRTIDLAAKAAVALAKMAGEEDTLPGVAEVEQ